jgi:tetratricopeptide (TPR) repeat protein
MRKLDPSASQILVEEAISQQPNQPIYYAMLAQLTLDDPISSRQAIETALRYWPDESAWHLLAASLNERLQDQPASLFHHRQAAMLKPENADYQYELGKALVNTGDHRQAIEKFEEAARLAPDQEGTWLSLAYAYLREGQFDKALTCAEKACEINPEGIENRLLYAQVALKMERLEMATDTVNSILAKSPRHPGAILLMTEILQSAGKRDQALNFIEAALQSCQATLELRLKHANLIEQLNGLAVALPYYKELGVDFPDHPQILAHLSLALAETGDYDTAQKTAETALQLDPEQESLHLLLGRLLRSKGQLDQAIHHLSQAINHSSTLVEAYLELAQVYKDRREHSQVLNVLRQCIQVAPDDPRSYYQAAMVFREAKDFTSAETMLRHAARLAPEDTSIRRQLAAIIALNLVHSTQEAVAVS